MHKSQRQQHSSRGHNTHSSLLEKLKTIQEKEFESLEPATKALPIIPPDQTLPELLGTKYIDNDDALFSSCYSDRKQTDMLSTSGDPNGNSRARMVHVYDHLLHPHCCENTDSRIRVWTNPGFQTNGSTSRSVNLFTNNNKENEKDNWLDDPSELSSIEHEFTFRNARILNQLSAPRKAYRPTHMDFRSTIHWGQRKLLMSEIEFLTLFAPCADYYGANKQIIVVYAGAAPGRHIAYLAELFPYLKFILVDPNNFDPDLSSSEFLRERIQMRQEYFTEEMTREFSSENEQNSDKVFLFLSDIRSADPHQQAYDEHESWVKQDMDRQMNWIAMMKPRYSMVKFRLPYDPGYTLYLDGWIFLPIWGRQATTETRLVVDGENMKLKWYDNKEYEEQMFYFNRVTRISLFPHVARSEGIDYCYDCRSEVFVLEMYLRRVRCILENKNQPSLALCQEISSMIERITRDISAYHGNRNLFQVIRSSEFKFNRVKHLRPEEQRDASKQHQRKLQVKEEDRYRLQKMAVMRHQNEQEHKMRMPNHQVNVYCVV
ncbi:hypothetical protein C9374_010403 [Naegleria lovaniensis]|uniref:Cap-specific mRNA (nucleoside-2'-O-)-methyltransferase n=1 Tax=Naegleria lovaniensis TaxID=51637 RepID=A0AA88KGE5_NAELO|nr:uncharacterized protein C9374_010403 [Naegleria lovaniensis]KAG2374826.1 hypothetical protein C9374_010403 [Naegleria lovaniensis]